MPRTFFSSASRNSDEDLIKVNELFEKLGLDIVAKHSFRLGKVNVGRVRPVKLVFESEREVSIIFKNKQLFVSKKLMVQKDQTPRERDYLNELKAELQTRINKGEKDLTIKYVNQTPIIISKNARGGNTR